MKNPSLPYNSGVMRIQPSFMISLHSCSSFTCSKSGWLSKKCLNDLKVLLWDNSTGTTKLLYHLCVVFDKHYLIFLAEFPVRTRKSCRFLYCIFMSGFRLKSPIPEQGAYYQNLVKRILTKKIHEPFWRPIFGFVRPQVGLNSRKCRAFRCGKPCPNPKIGRQKGSWIFSKDSFDKILVDAPCSGIGLLRRKPDIKYNKERQISRPYRKFS